MALKSNLAEMHCLNEQIERLESEILKMAKLRPEVERCLPTGGGTASERSLSVETVT
ncbi:hypothetical protein ACCUM_2560 [Candidatus Accumulibacter phosphatis]|uniref:Uncharacterized protein n=1 Tax=Candidatus Accumulibacter phosphatis TaxID=327160 RepID=A0A5S4EI08_9PROT|nr:hypothetical protein ACCUM_2560 [Candidatus Accumulibacter phosphatis]